MELVIVRHVRRSMDNVRAHVVFDEVIGIFIYSSRHDLAIVVGVQISDTACALIRAGEVLEDLGSSRVVLRAYIFIDKGLTTVVASTTGAIPVQTEVLALVDAVQLALVRFCCWISEAVRELSKETFIVAWRLAAVAIVFTTVTNHNFWAITSKSKVVRLYWALCLVHCCP